MPCSSKGVGTGHSPGTLSGEGETGLLFVQELSRHWGPCPGAAEEASGQMENSRPLPPTPPSSSWAFMRTEETFLQGLKLQPDPSQTPGAVRSPGSWASEPCSALPDLRPEELVNPSQEGVLWLQKTSPTLDHGAKSLGDWGAPCNVCWPLKEVLSARGSREHTPSWNWGSGADPGHSPKLHAVLLCAMELWVWWHMTGALREG